MKRSNLIGNFLKNSVYCEYLISFLMSYVPRNKEHTKLCSTAENVEMHPSAYSSPSVGMCFQDVPSAYAS